MTSNFLSFTFGAPPAPCAARHRRERYTPLDTPAAPVPGADPQLPHTKPAPTPASATPTAPPEQEF